MQFSMPIFGMLMGPALWGFGGKWQDAVRPDQEVTIKYWEKHGL